MRYLAPCPAAALLLLLLVSPARAVPADGAWEPVDGVPGAALTAAVGAIVYAVESYDDGSGPRLFAAGGMRVVGNARGRGLFRQDGTGWTSIGEIDAGTAYCAAVWDGKLVVAGTFTEIDNVSMKRIAAWDGAAWSPLGAGIPNGQVFGLIAHDGDLYATGTFSQAGDSAAAGVARWDGATWHPLGAGIDGTGEALVVFEGDLVVGGAFTTAGGAPAKNVARWDGASWSAFGAGVQSSRVYALEVFDTDGAGPNPPRLVAGGTFCSACSSYLIEWNGIDWTSFAGSVGGGGVTVIKDLDVWNGDLVVTGSFQTVGPSAYPASRIALWNPLAGWSGLAAGLNPRIGSGSSVEDVTVLDGALVACGTFWNDGRVATTGLARWGGSAWEALGSGFGGVYDPFVLALAATDSGLVAAGTFTSAGDALNANNVIRFSGSSWDTFGTGTGGGVEANEDAKVNAVIEHAGGLYLAFETFTTSSGWRTGVAVWNGAAWINSFTVSTYAPVYALASHGGDLYAGGQFTTVSSIGYNRVARWDGVSWQPLGSGVGNTVRALCSFDGDLIAGGDFTTAGGAPALRVARWDGTQWWPLGGGLTGAAYALAVHDGDLYAGCTNGVYRWDGSAWNLVGTVAFGTVYALLSHGGHLYVAGSFPQIPAPGLSDTRYVARWDGAEWQALGTGLEDNRSAAQARALAAWDGSIWVGSNLYVAGGAVSSYLARWTPAAATGVEEESAPSPIFARVHPNPFPSHATIAWSLERAGDVAISIHDVAGRRIRALRSGRHESGVHEAVWDGRDDAGRPVTAGTYFARIVGPDGATTAKLVRLR